MKMIKCIHRLDGFTLGKTYFIYKERSNRWIEVENDNREFVIVDRWYFEEV